MTLTRIQIAALGVAALLLAGGGFVAGMTAGPALGVGSPTAAPSGGAPSGALVRRGAGANPAGAAAGASVISGRVISVNDGSITVEATQPGGSGARSVIALVGEGARVVRTTETDATVADIKAGEEVTIVGATDPATGTVSASSVMIGASPLRLFGGGGRP